MNTNLKLAVLGALAALIIVSPDASARKKQKVVLDGSCVNIGQTVPAIPIESRYQSGLSIKPTKTVYLYPLGQNVDQGIVENGKEITKGPLLSNEIDKPEAVSYGFIVNVSDSARFDLYIPEKCNGIMVIATPGGSYGSLSSLNEGMYVAKWLNDRNMACAVLKYRLPNGHWQVPLQDVHNTLRYCRAHAEEWGVKKIGVAGFSAGGHLASTAATMYVDAITKPDFAALFYPVISMKPGVTHSGTRENLLGSPATWASRDNYSFDDWYSRQGEAASLVEKYSTQNDVTSSTPPIFITLSSDDSLVPAENSLLFYESLAKSRTSAELHIYPSGEHGWGFTDHSIGIPSSLKDNLGKCRAEFSADFERWLMQVLDLKAQSKSQTKPMVCQLQPSETVLLYPEGQNVDKGIEGVTLGPGESNGLEGPEVLNKENNLYNVGDSARFDLYLAKNPNGKMVIICPGGAYIFTAIEHEGRYAAEWLNSQGISAAVLKYRLPNGHCTVPLTDVQNTFRYCRKHAAEWGINKIGVMGFSAGGHLAASASTLYVDAITRPDFSILVYPVISSDSNIWHAGSYTNLIGSKENWMKRTNSKEGESSYTSWRVGLDRYNGLLERYSLDKQVSSDTPPTFLIFSSNDYGVPVFNEMRYYRSLLKYGVPCEMHAFPSGTHGYGFKSEKYGKDPIAPYRQDFLASMARFLQNL